MSWQLSNMQWSIMYYSRHSVCYFPVTNLLYNWNFVPFDHFHPFRPRPASTNLFSVLLWTGLLRPRRRTLASCCGEPPDA